ncbi:MAG: HPr kinase/phosphatase C-terminal domain-containing protein [Alphaproteobacteria bacterium]
MTVPSIHASAVLVGTRAVLIRGPAGSGKSRLALALVRGGSSGALPFTRLVGDDRVHVEAVHGRLLVRPAEALAGLIEVRGLGIRRLPYEPLAVAGLVIDLAAADSERLPLQASAVAEVAGIALPRLAVAPGVDPYPLVIAALRTSESDQ